MRMHILAATLMMTAAMPGCNTTPAQDGAVLGGALGAGLGAVIGNQRGHAGEGALIGAGAGALTGALIGDQVGRERHRQQQTVYPAPRPDASVSAPRQTGHYEMRIVRPPSGERYEERVWVPDP
jgi:hypothetical protein